MRELYICILEICTLATQGTLYQPLLETITLGDASEKVIDEFYHECSESEYERESLNK